MKVILRNTPQHGDLLIEFSELELEDRFDMDDFLNGFKRLRYLYKGLISNNTIYTDKINILSKKCPNCKHVKINYL